MRIGVDIGGSHIKAGIVIDNEVNEKITIKTPKTKKKFLEELDFSIRLFDNKRIKFIGVGCPGPGDYDKGIIRNTPNIPIKDFNLLRYLNKRFSGKKIKIENDAACFVLGESLKLDERIVTGYTVGTGVGGGIVIDNKIFKGRDNAGELGKVPILSGIGKDSKKVVKLEDAISGKAIKRLYKKEIKDITESQWKKISSYLACAISGLVYTIDPQVVVIGGGVIEHHNKMIQQVKTDLKKYLILKMPKIVQGKSDSGIIGAANIF